MKKSLLGILAVLMVIALALTGCGQKGEQNAEATGSGDGNGSSVSEPSYEPEKAGENAEDVGDNESSGEINNEKPAQDADGNYVYLITVDGVQTEIKTCVNVWDYIEHDTPYDRVYLTKMAEDLGWEKMPAGFGAARYNRSDGSFALVGGLRTVEDYNLPTGERRLYQQTVVCYDGENVNALDASAVVSSYNVSNDPYLIGKSDTYVSFEQIVMYAYMVDYYRSNASRIFDTPDGFVDVP